MMQDPADTFELPTELRKLLSARESASVKDEILLVHARLLRESATRSAAERPIHGRHLPEFFDFVAGALRSKPGFADLLADKIPMMVYKINDILGWYPVCNFELMKQRYLAGPMLAWRIEAGKIHDRDLIETGFTPNAESSEARLRTEIASTDVEDPSATFGQTKKNAREMFDSMAREGLSGCADAATYKRWLDDAGVNARSGYLAHKSPEWDHVWPAKELETGREWFEPREAKLLAQKDEYERNLKYLDGWFSPRKQYWLEKYALRPPSITGPKTIQPKAAITEDKPFTVSSQDDGKRIIEKDNDASARPAPVTPQDSTQPATSDGEVLQSESARTAGRRTPDLQSSRERVGLVGVLARELAIVKQETRVHCTVELLKGKHPKFTLWSLIEDSQIKELVEGEAFTPKAYATNLVLAKYGLTSRETLKKDRRKIRNAPKAGSP